MFFDKVKAAIKVECDRQHVGEDRQEMLKYAWDELSWDVTVPFHTARLRAIARMIEPSNRGQYRTTPVSFKRIVGGVPPESIERAMARWIQAFNEELKTSRLHDIEEWKVRHADAVIKEFLDIHPFSDGNGRTAWLLRVWMLDQWNDPQPLPDYYG